MMALRFAFAHSVLQISSAAADVDFWQLVPSAEVAKKLPHSKWGSGNPECMQGLVYMDQQCTTGASLPSSYKCATLDGRAAQNEYLAAFGQWNSTTHCVTMLRSSWTFGASDLACTICNGEAPTFCQTNFDEVGPCEDGAYFKGPFIFDLKKTSFGWDRVSPIISEKLFRAGHYPLLRIVDGHGQKTKWFSAYMEEVSLTQCPSNRPHCRLNEWAANGQMANCLRSSSGVEQCQLLPTWAYIIIALVAIGLLVGIAFCCYHRCRGGMSKPAGGTAMSTQQHQQEDDRAPLVPTLLSKRAPDAADAKVEP